MSATNTTTNYNLPIFIGSDKPAWLVDFNGAMNAIDAQMKVNADAIATKSPILTFNDTTEIDFTKTGNVITASLASGVSDKVGRALVTPIAAPATEQIVAIDTNGAQAAVNVGSGLKISSGTLKSADLDLTNIGTATLSGFPSGVTKNSGDIQYALNTDGTIGKIYGTISFKNTSSSPQNITINTDIQVAATGESYTINPAGLNFSSDLLRGGITLSVSAAGNVSLVLNVAANANTYCYYIPCIYFFKNFGDVPTP